MTGQTALDKKISEIGHQRRRRSGITLNRARMARSRKFCWTVIYEIQRRLRELGDAGFTEQDFNDDLTDARNKTTARFVDCVYKWGRRVGLPRDASGKI